MTKRIVRLLLTAALLTFVWMNSHWSVALAITLLTIANELSVLEHELKEK